MTACAGQLAMFPPCETDGLPVLPMAVNPAADQYSGLATADAEDARRAELGRMSWAELAGVAGGYGLAVAGGAWCELLAAVCAAEGL